ncbi:hypothetical protein FM106_01090 [Brachybacterium faecium]|nr:hypothetical protein FM106_01090 [Brachybacterium faecium]
MVTSLNENEECYLCLLFFLKESKPLAVIVGEKISVILFE